MTIKEYLSHLPTNEITNALIYIDYWLNYLHNNNCFIVGNVGDAHIEDNFIKADKYDYLDSGYDEHGDLSDIEELCYVGICAYNHFKHHDYNFSDNFKKAIKENLNIYINTGNVPRVMKEYYIEVLQKENVIYLNEYLNRIGYFDNQEAFGNAKGKVKTKSTLPGRALSNHDEAAYANVLVIPSLIALVYLIIVVCYFVFFR